MNLTTTYSLETERFGLFEIRSDETFRIVEPMPGFENLGVMALVPVDEAGIFVWFQSVEPPDVAFLAVNPFAFHPSYDIEVTTDTIERLETVSAENVVVYTLVTIRGSDATTNLAAPFIVDVSTRRAIQVILDADWPLRAPIDFGVRKRSLDD